MSYEGYIQRLCKNGHYREIDCYFDDDAPCPECNAEIAWQHNVDTTNDAGNPIKLKVKRKRICKHCKSVLEVIYFIPKQ